MTSRLDRLVTLLETGSTNLIRNTAAQQLADLQKQHPDDLFNLLSRVLPFLRSNKWDTRVAAAKALGGIIDHAARFDPNAEENHPIKKEDPSLATTDDEPKAEPVEARIKAEADHDTPKDEPMTDASLNRTDQLHLSTLDLASILRYGRKLLGSGDKQQQYALAALASDVRLAWLQRTLPARLGLLGEDPEEEPIPEPDITSTTTNGNGASNESKVDPDADAANKDSKNGRSPSHPRGPEDKGLSKRQLNQLKRKQKADVKHQASKIRVTDLAGPRRDSELPTPSGNESMTFDLETRGGSDDGPDPSNGLFSLDRTTNDDETKVVSEFKGAFVPAKPDIQTEAEEDGTEWPLERLSEVLAADLFDARWEVRHGAAMGLREILRAHGAGAGRHRGLSRRVNDARNQAWLDDIACRLIAVLMLDRFGDYISDHVVAPVRETAGQALGRLFLHLDATTLERVYTVLLRMVLQRPDDVALKHPVWEVAHGGLLGLKYLGAVRVDVVTSHLDGIIEAVLKGLADGDDDVRAVSAATLIPVAESLVRLRPQALRQIIQIVWDGLADSGDDLSASTGFVMDLLATLCRFDAVIEAMLENAKASSDQTANEDDDDPDNASPHSFQNLVPRLYPFLRHTLPGVRAAVLRALETFLKVKDTNHDIQSWADARAVRLLFQNVILERTPDVVTLSLQVWSRLNDVLRDPPAPERLASIITTYWDQMLPLALQPIGIARHPIPIPPSLILKPSGQLLAEPSSAAHRPQRSPTGEPAAKKRRRSEKKEEPVVSHSHNVDGHMLQGDVDLIGAAVLVHSRVSGAEALGRALSLVWQSEPHPEMLAAITEALTSPYATTQMVAAMLIEEQALHAKTAAKEGTEFNAPVLPDSTLAALDDVIHADRPEFYSELTGYLQVARAQCQLLLNLFRDVAKVPASRIPSIAVVVQGDTGAGPSAFSIANAQTIVDSDFERLRKSLSAAQRLTSAGPLQEARGNVQNAIDEARAAKEERDVRVRAAAAAALVARQEVPRKPGRLIKALMDSVKSESNLELQDRAARAVARLLAVYEASGSGRGPAEKIVGNLLKFVCVDTADTPEYEVNAAFEDIIMSLRKEEDHKDHADAVAYEREALAARITRRGAQRTLEQVSRTFQSKLFEYAANIRSTIEQPLQTALPNVKSAELQILDATQGQAVVDAFTILRVIMPTLNEDLYTFVDEMLPYVLAALTCPSSVIRYAAAKCFATLCSVRTVATMTRLVEEVLPAIGNPLHVRYRQGAIETIYHLIHLMEDSILPYVVFLIVPILGRMSDSDPEVRLIATTTFATLVKLVPLEAGIPDPPGFSEELLRGRDKERRFVAQMLDPKKTEKFELPVAIRATLRSYQQDGVNWLAFLNRFNLHGVLCDDMGLGKTLQTLCIVASDHHMRAERYAKTQAPEDERLPSLIVCPPTLSGHWQQEIQTYAPFLSSMAYVGPPAERQRLAPSLGKSDIVITSYDVCRNDLDRLLPLRFNYCVLDEGHLIKNPRAKTTLAVKALHSNHRLILSGTPIQNNVLELWSLFDFLMPGFLGAEKVFQERFAKPIAASRNAKASSKEQERGALAIESLHKQVLPFLLRRLKEEVLDDLPPKIVQNYYCDLSDLQRQLFEDFASREKKALATQAGSADKEAKQHIFQALQYMRKLCNSPALVVREGHKQYPAVQRALQSRGSSLRDIAHAPKLNALRELLLECGIGVASGVGDDMAGSSSAMSGAAAATAAVSQHRALIFCQMKEMLDIVEQDVLRSRLSGVQYLRLDGGVEASRRQGIVNRFNTDPSYDVLLLTTSVGGLGLNLTGADTVIFVEHDWNPQKDLQAMDRAHRIGQKKVVNVYRLITRGTLEEKILNLQRFKIDVASTVVNQQNAGLGTMDTDQILDLFNIDDAGSSGISRGADGDGEGAGSTADTAHGREEDMVDATGEVRAKGKKGLLDDLGELWDENQYAEEYNLDSFLAGMKV